VWVLSAAQARTLPGPAFLKPPNQKTFPAKVYTSGAALPEMPEDDPVLASEPVEWVAEFRFFIRDRRVRAWSPYWRHGALARQDDEWIVDPDLMAMTRGLVDRLLADPHVDIPAALVLDAGVIREIGPAVVEANAASGAGIYGCDPRDALEVLRAATIKAGEAGWLE
jgi:ATP-grasp domain, R2K clade family 2